MTYSVKEIYYTLQGEGVQSGRPAVFLRFTGCNLWSGRDRDRPAAQCRFCDTDFVGTDGPGGGRFSTATELSAAVKAHWPPAQSDGRPYDDISAFENTRAAIDFCLRNPRWKLSLQTHKITGIA